MRFDEYLVEEIETLKWWLMSDEELKKSHCMAETKEFC